LLVGIVCWICQPFIVGLLPLFSAVGLHALWLLVGFCISPVVGS
jgi:hypothetical protein